MPFLQQQPWNHNSFSPQSPSMEEVSGIVRNTSQVLQMNAFVVKISSLGASCQTFTTRYMFRMCLVTFTEPLNSLTSFSAFHSLYVGNVANIGGKPFIFDVERSEVSLQKGFELALVSWSESDDGMGWFKRSGNSFSHHLQCPPDRWQVFLRVWQ